MNTIATPGYEPTISNETKAQNIIARLVAVVSPDEAGSIVAECVKTYMEISDDFIRSLDWMTRQAESKHASGETLETVAARQQRLECELSENPTKERALAIIGELAEIEAWYQREMNFIEPDAKLCARYGDQL
jgi:hypothetical protein